MPDNTSDNLEAKKNRPINRKVAAGILGLMLIVAASSFITPDPNAKKKDQDAPHYSMSAPSTSLKALPKRPEQVQTAEPPSQIIVQIDHEPIIPEQEEPPDTPEPVPAPARSRPERTRRSNPLEQQWMAQQLQAFRSGTTATSWSAADKKQDSQSQINQRDSSYLDLYREMMDQESQKQGTEQTQKTAQELFFENAGNVTKGTLTHTRQAKVAPYVIPAGSVIPCVLITGINSDLQGNLTAQVSENVCDWTNPRAVLIPQGTLVFGTYDSQQLFGQKRAQVKWSRLTFPDGSTLDLEGMPGVDRQGYSGLKDKYNGHYNSMITAAILVSAFSALGEIFDDDDSSVYIGSSSTTVESEVAEAIGDMGEKIFSKFVDRQPTVVIRPGKTFMIQANADIPFTRTWTVR